MTHRHIMTHRFAIVLLLAMLATALRGQSLNSAYFIDDYKFRHDMNPAFANDQNYLALPLIGNILINTRGNFGYDAVVMPNPLAGQAGQKQMTSFMNPYIDTSTALRGFSKGDNCIVGDVGIAVLSSGFKGYGGYNTIEINWKSSFGASLPYELLEFAKNTGNKTYDIGDISLTALSYAEIALGHSHDVSERLRLGAKIKVLLGMGRADLCMKNFKADLADDSRWLIQGNAVADVSMKNFSYKEKVKDYRSDSRDNYHHVTGADMDKIGLSGFGMAIDLGAQYVIGSDWSLSGSILNLGFIRWNNDMQARNINSGFMFDGFHDVSLVSDRPGPNGTFEEQSKSYGDQLTDFINLQDQGNQGGRTTGIGATLNIGVAYRLPSYKSLTFGLLSSTRFSGSYSWTEARLSTNFASLKWLDGGVNVGISSLATSTGWVLNIHPRGYNFFIGMDHILGKQSKEGIPLSSNASVNVGMSIAW